MTNSDTDFEESPTTVDGLRYSITTLWNRYGQTDSAVKALLINSGMALLGVIPIVLGMHYWIQALGFAWFVINFLPVLNLVIGE